MNPAISNDFYKDGFFGYGDQGDFKLWSFAHFAPIILMIGIIVLIYVFRKKIAKSKHEENIRYILGFLMLIEEMSYYWRVLYVGSADPNKSDLLTLLPLQVCEWSCIFSAFMIMKKSKNLYDICYYVCLVCSVIPLFTPIVITNAGPTYYRYYQFWGEHTLPIIAVLYLTFVHGFRPSLIKIYKPICFLLVLAIIAAIANKLIPGADYLYMSGNTEGVPIMGLLPSNVYGRMAVLTAIFLVLFICVYYITQLVMLINKKISERKTVKAD